jgi:hypothetical protein
VSFHLCERCCQVVYLRSGLLFEPLQVRSQSIFERDRPPLTEQRLVSAHVGGGMANIAKTIPASVTHQWFLICNPGQHPSQVAQRQSNTTADVERARQTPRMVDAGDQRSRDVAREYQVARHLAIFKQFDLAVRHDLACKHANDARVPVCKRLERPVDVVTATLDTQFHLRWQAR